jgi:4a-hydroxytetrahydrobiopterin dehydratase
METAEQLRQAHCRPCHGDTPGVSRHEAEQQLHDLPEWKLSDDGRSICREWFVQDFAEAMRFFSRIAEVAEAEDHHPNLRLENYRRVTVELTTHAIHGLSENDFILAAKIDDLPVALKRQ